MGAATIFGIVSTCGGIVLFYLGLKKKNESNTLSKYVPTDSITSIPFGIPVMITGTVTADQPLTSPITQKPCVYFEYVLERETKSTDSKGNASWSWQRVGAPELQKIPFYLQDQHGKILIKPDGCEVNGIFHTEQLLQPGTIQNAQSLSMKILSSAIHIANNAQGNRERVTEDTILTGSTINIFGILTMEGVQKFLQKTNDYPLILSPLSKEQLVGSENKTAYTFYSLALALIVIGLFLIFYK